MMMDVRPIRTDADYEWAWAEVSAYMEQDPEPGTPDGGRFEVLLALLDVYEREHHPIGLPDPVAAIEFAVEQRGLSRRDLEPAIGSRARVSEVLNRRRALTMEMVRKLVPLLGLSAEVLIQSYPVQRKPRRAGGDPR